MLKKIRQFFLKIREKDDSAKKRWLIFLASASMAVVIIFWSFYLNQTIKSIAADNEQPDKNEEFFSVFKNGAKILAKETGSKLSKLIDSLQSLLTDTNSITIGNKENSEASAK